MKIATWGLLALLLASTPTEAGRVKRVLYTFAISAGACYAMLYGIDSDHTSQTQKEKITMSAGVGLAFVGLIEAKNLRHKAFYDIKSQKISLPVPYIKANKKRQQLRTNLLQYRF